ncbi:Tautomerase/MIF [Trametopsis cervina]|nr:Tautomerase/MIF [Trametopsis cervina]
MPSLVLTTNVKIDDVKPFIQKLSKYASEVLGKPEEYMCCTYNYNEHMLWHGTFDPALELTIISLGNISPQSNIEYTKKLFEFFEAEIGVPKNRGYIFFSDPGRENVGSLRTSFGILASVN